MKSITCSEELKEAILQKELEGLKKKIALQESFTGFIDDLKPINIIKHTLQSTFTSENKDDLIKGALSLGTGILTKRLFLGGSSNIIRKVLSTALQFGVSGIIAKNAETIKEKGAEWIGKLFQKKKNKKDPDSGKFRKIA